MSTKMDELGSYFAKIALLYQQWAKQNGSNYNELAVLHSAATLGQCTQKRICEKWLIPKQTVSAVCNQLKEQGYLQFVQGDADKREKMMSLTAQGQRHAAPLLDNMQKMEQRLFHQLGEENSRQLLALIRQFCLRLEEQVKG